MESIRVEHKKTSRILIHPPTHPLLTIVYVFGGVIIASMLSYLVAGGSILLPWRLRWQMYLASLLFALSPILSYVNIIVKEVRTGFQEPVMTIELTSVYGIPVPVPKIVMIEHKVILAVNIGGALIPVLVSGLFLHIAISMLGARALYSFIAAYAAVTLATYASSRVVPGAGVAVPALLPPMVSAIVVSFAMGGGLLPGIVAYAAGSLGSLTGADILRLFKEIYKLPPGLASIGGVGVFDGIFLSGALSLFFTL